MTTENKTSQLLNVLLWMAQALLAATLLWAACTKLFKPADELAVMWPWTAKNAGLVKFSAFVDFLAGLGILLPSLLRIRPQLVVVTAYFILALMIGASIFHINRGESSQIGINIFFAFLAIFVAWGRDRKVRIKGR
ncbi:hypothetical protein CNR22_16135 [Sphingobacteriaceae bacterium]|nr:hypothetical protein CNR22_16135 [Sphingobacteriaceae bacterium]